MTKVTHFTFSSVKEMVLCCDFRAWLAEPEVSANPSETTEDSASSSKQMGQSQKESSLP